MSSFPMACNVVHARRYGNARSMRQMSEPNGLVTRTTSTESTRSPSPVRHRQHHSADSPTRKHQLQEMHANAFSQPHSKIHSLTRHVQRSLNLGHIGEMAPASLLSKHSLPEWHSASVKAVSGHAHSRNTLPPSVKRKSMESVNEYTDKKDFNMMKKKHGKDSGFGSAFNLTQLGLGGSNGNNGNSSFFKAQTDSLIDALQSFAAQQNQN